MAKEVLLDAYVGINGTAISDHVSSVTIEDTADDVELTTFSGSNYREFGVGLRNAQVTLHVFQDYASGQVDSIFQPLYASGGTFGLEVRPHQTTVSSTNPKYTMTSRLYGWGGIAGAIGEANDMDVTIRNAGTAGLVKGTS